MAEERAGARRAEHPGQVCRQRWRHRAACARARRRSRSRGIRSGRGARVYRLRERLAIAGADRLHVDAHCEFQVSGSQNPKCGGGPTISSGLTSARDRILSIDITSKNLDRAERSDLKPRQDGGEQRAVELGQGGVHARVAACRKRARACTPGSAGVRGVLAVASPQARGGSQPRACSAEARERWGGSSAGAWVAAAEK